MDNFNKKQKIILVILSTIVIGGIYYFVYSKDNNFENIETLENINNKTNEENKEGDSVDDEIYSDSTIFVHVSGAVNKEGVVELKPNSRISDAIDKADGLKEDAYIKDLNLAFKLEDGMKLYVPTNKEKEQEIIESSKNNSESIDKDSKKSYITTNSGINSIVNSKNNMNENNNSIKEKDSEKNNTKQGTNSKININTATQSELETLPGIGPATALKIINYRKEHGEFSDIEDIKEVSGIGDAKYNSIKDLIKT